MNSTDRQAIERYAAAYDALSATNEDASRRAAELSTVAEALAGVQYDLTNPRVPLAKKKEAIQDALAGVPETASFVEVLLDARRYALLPDIVRRVEDLLDKRLGIVRAVVWAARDLSPEQKTRTQEALSARYGAAVEATYHTEPSLLGGLKIWCRGELLDGSLQGQLAKLQEELVK